MCVCDSRFTIRDCVLCFLLSVFYLLLAAGCWLLACPSCSHSAALVPPAPFLDSEIKNRGQPSQGHSSLYRRTHTHTHTHTHARASCWCPPSCVTFFPPSAPLYLSLFLILAQHFSPSPCPPTYNAAAPRASYRCTTQPCDCSCSFHRQVQPVS